MSEPSETSPSTTVGRRFATRLLFLACWLYLGLNLLLWALVQGTGDRWWVGSLLIFSPRWPYGLPLAILVPAAIVCRGRTLWLTAIAAAIWLGPVMGLCVPWQGQHATPGTRLRVVSWNMQNGIAGQRDSTSLLRTEVPDVIFLQEAPPGLVPSLEQEFPLRDVYPYRVQRLGLALLSRYEVSDLHSVDRQPFGGRGTVALACRVQLPDGPARLVNVHLTTPRPGFRALLELDPDALAKVDALTHRRSEESQFLAAWIADQFPLALVAGDFNMPVESYLYRRDWGRYTNAFTVTGWGFGQTKFTRLHGVRIDHCLLLEGRFLSCRVAGRYRSDHRPLVCELELPTVTLQVEKGTQRP